MTLQEILKSQGLSDEQITTIVGEMKQNKIFTSSEENLDVRYGKLKTEHEALTNKDSESQKLIAELQQASKDNEGIQSKIAEYQATIEKQSKELEHVKVQSALKVLLLGAKAVDVDYLTFKAMEKHPDGFKLDDSGNIKGGSELLTELKTGSPNMFETSVENKNVDEHKLEDNNHNNEGLTLEQFNKMGYQQRLQLKQEQPDIYDKMTGRND